MSTLKRTTYLLLATLFTTLLLATPISAEAGYTWTEQTGSGQRGWMSLASSSDGTKLAAVAYYASGPTFIYTSTNSGVTWTEQTGSGERLWWSVSSSADGRKLVAAALNGFIYTSTNSGVTWTEQTGSGERNWQSTTSSTDGTRLAAIDGDNGYIYTSNNSGATWTERTVAGNKEWISITSSADGTKLAAVEYGGYIYTSTDSGASWTEQTGAGSRYWQSITSSADGTKLAVASHKINTDLSGEYIYTSTNSGATWTSQNSAGSRNWVFITFSADGSKLVAGDLTTDGVNLGYIYTATFTPPPPTQTTFQNAENAKNITLTTPADTTLTCHSAVKESSLSTVDKDKTYPLGLVDFCLSVPEASTQEITLTFTTDLKPPDTVARKYNPNTKQYSDVPGATITETTVEGSHALVLTYQITDGGELDTDGTANGTILDPVGLAVTNDSTAALAASATGPNTNTLANTGTNTNAIITTATLLTLTGALALASRKYSFSKIR